VKYPFKLLRFVTFASLVAVCLLSPFSDASAVEPPSYASAAGYTVNTFSSFTSQSIDLTNSGRSGFQWYPWNFFGLRAQTEKIVVNSDGSVTLNGDTTTTNGELATAMSANNSAKFVGTAFGGGGYIEASIMFDPATVAAANSKGWPSFWAMSLEHVSTQSEQWKGKSQGYLHFIEVDIFEYDMLPSKLGQNYYGATMHDWYGNYKQTCAPAALCRASRPISEVRTMVPAATDFRQYHRYGFLWVPATATHPGYAQYYFDGNAVGPALNWTKYTDQPAIPDGQPWQYGVIDKQHLVLILGTGLNEPMTIRSVNVWQSSSSQNLHN
jgi:hypothetical protein